MLKTFTALAMILCAMLCAGVGGCAPAPQDYRFGIRVRNDGPDAITMGVIRVGPPFEMRFATPEELASSVPMERIGNWGQVVPPGKLAQLMVDGKFGGQTRAYLRIYAGAPTLPLMLATSRDSGERVDVQIFPHGNFFIVDDRSGALQVTPVKSLPKP